MRKSLLLLLIVLLPHAVRAQLQPLQPLVDSVMAHSPRIRALQAHMEADQAAAHAENRLADPEVTFRYMWGSPAGVENEKDLTISQSFELPSAYLHRSQLKRHDIHNARLQYQAGYHDVLLQASQLAIELCYSDSLLALQQRRLTMSEEFYQAESRRLAEGATSIFQFNEAQRLALTSHQEVNRLTAEREALLAEFRVVCGFDYQSHTVALADLQQLILLPQGLTFDAWWQPIAESSPEMQLVQNTVTRAGLEVKTARDGWLPKLTVGYESELTHSDKLRGVSLGLSVPLWSNGGKVRAARRALEAAQLEAEEQKLSFYTRLQGLFLRTVSSVQSVHETRTLLSGQRNDLILRHSLDEGLITRPDYLEGMIGLLDAQRTLLEEEKSAALLWIELNSIRLSL